MFQHAPWVGTDYNEGLSRCRVAIVGNSHWLEEGETDQEDCTVETVSKVCTGAYGKIAFFNQIRGYFGYADPCEFWNRVAFFNFAPRCIGTRDNRYGSIPPGAVEEARGRFVEILEKTQPDKVFVFSSAIRWMLPVMDRVELAMPLKAAFRGRLSSSELASPIYMLRHPERAPKNAMTETVMGLMVER